MTTALVNVEDIHDAASEDEDMREESDDLDEEQPVPTFGEAVAAFEMMWHYLSSFPIDDASMQRLTQLDRELLFRQTCHSK
jgi:centromere protein B